MPIYQYQDLKNGGIIERFATVPERDNVPPYLKRITVPFSVDVVGGRLDPTSADAACPRAMREMEDTMSHREIAWRAGFTTEELKQVWKP